MQCACHSGAGCTGQQSTCATLAAARVRPAPNQPPLYAPCPAPCRGPARRSKSGTIVFLKRPLFVTLALAGAAYLWYLSAAWLSLLGALLAGELSQGWRGWGFQGSKGVGGA